MKTFSLIILTFVLSLFPNLVTAQDHAHGVKHNMLMFGETEIFLSHLVYKVPHHYQVILRVNFDEATKAMYLSEKKKYPQDDFVFLLDEMNIQDISSVASLTGNFIRSPKEGKRMTLKEGIQILKQNFSLIYFDELPLNLGRSE